MADTFENYTAYNTVISQAISDFDSIQGKLRDKGVVDGSGTELKADTTGVATSEYAGLIDDQLFRVNGKKKADLTAGLTNGVINYLGTVTLNGTSLSYATGGDSSSVRYLTVTAANDKSGYIDGSNTALTVGQIEAENLVLDDNSLTSYYDADAEQYVIKAAQNKVLEGVTVAKGSGLIDATATSSTCSGSKNEIALNAASDNDNINGSATLATPADDDLANYVKLDIKATAECQDTVVTTLSKTFTSGYINKEDVKFNSEGNKELSENGVLTHVFDAHDHINSSQAIYLPKGSAGNLKAKEGTAKVAFDGATDIVADSGSELSADDTFAEITAKVDGLQIEGTITKGWVESGNISATSIDVANSSIKIKKGSLTAGSTNVHLAAEGSKTGLISSAATDYKITLTKDAAATEADASNVALSVTNGYLTSAMVANAKHTVSVESTDVYITGAAVKKKVSGASVALTGTGATYLTGTAPDADSLSDYYTVDTKVSASIVDDGSTDGYFEGAKTGAFVGTGLNAEKTNTFYLKKGSVKFAHGLTLSDGASASGLLASKPSKGTLGTDYFSISTSGTYTANEGYITEADVSADENKTYYLPKAVVEYVTDSSDTSFLQVKTAGFLPTGTIQVTEGTLDEAAVKGTLSDTGNVISTTATTGYAISIAKSLTAGDAGYISANKGTLSLAETYYIAHGSLSYKAGIADIEVGAPTRAGDKFNISLVAKADATVKETLAEGYIKADDVTITAADDYSETVVLDEAQLAVSGSGSISASASSNVETSTTETKYVITPNFTSTALSATVSKAGYVDADTTVSGTVSIGDTKKLYITPGTTTTLTPTAHAKALSASEITSNLSSTVSGDYTVTINGKDSGTGTLAPGYYGEDEKTIGYNSVITGTYTVKHGSASITAASATFALTPESGLSLASTVADASQYYKITANASNLSLTKSVTEGYVKDADVNAGLSTITGSQDKYIAKYQWGADKISETQAVASGTKTVGDEANVSVYIPASTASFGEESDATIIHTNGTYVDKDIYVELGANAIGANAKADLEKLKQRLAGTLVKA